MLHNMLRRSGMLALVLALALVRTTVLTLALARTPKLQTVGVTVQVFEKVSPTPDWGVFIRDVGIIIASLAGLAAIIERLLLN